MERRKHIRLKINMPVEIILQDNVVIEGTTESINFGGTFVMLKKNYAVEVGTTCELNIILQKNGERIDISIKSRVTRDEQNGMGFKFLAIQQGDYIHFVNLMINNSPYPEGLEQELRENPGLLLDY